MKNSVRKKRWIVFTTTLLIVIVSSILLNFTDSLGFQNIENLPTVNEINTENQSEISSEEQLKVHVIDVGQGDSIFIELPYKKSMLIDAGEAKEADNIIKYIQELGYSKLDYIIGTHPHTDHIGGLSKIINTFYVETIYMPKAISTTKTYEKLLNTILEKNLKVKSAHSGLIIIEQEKLKIEFLSPIKSNYKELNNFSAVLKITYGNQKFLFMGDAEIEVEKEIKTDVSADVIKVGHHGSKSSSSEEFVNKVNPNYAVISVGKDNKYNHPNEEIVNRWKSVGANILLTSEYGTITFETNGEQLIVKTSKEK